MAARAMERGRGEAGERRGVVGAIGARGMKVAARAMERGRGKAGERRGGVSVIGARRKKVAERAMERGRGEAGESLTARLAVWERKWRRER